METHVDNLVHYISEKTSVNGHPVKACVDYELTAEVDAHHARDLKTHVHLTLGQRVDGPISPVEVSNRKSFMFNQGKLAMRAELDRDVYFPGDEVKMKLEVTNESVKKVRSVPPSARSQFGSSCFRSGLQVNGINVELVRNIRLRAHHHHFSHRHVIQHLRLEVGAPPQ